MNNKEVAHLWANFGQERAKGSHFYFEGPRLYSYGPHYLLGKLFPSSDRGEVALINSRGYSVTTAQHKSYAVGALCSSQWVIIRVPCPEAETVEDHRANMAYLIEQQKKRIEAAPRARHRLNTVLAVIEDAAEEYRAYCRRFKLLSKAPAFPGFSVEVMEELKARAERLKEEEDAREVKRQEAAKAKEAEALERWRNGESVQNYFYASDIALRLSADGKQIETSRGAAVETSAGVRLWKRWKAGLHLNLEKIGAYTVNEVAPEGVKIGCHFIKTEEINRFFEGTLKLTA